MALTTDEIQQIAAIVKATNEEGQHCERKHRFRKRLVVSAVMIGGSWLICRVLHFEQAHEAVIVAIDGFVACNIDKFIYGIA